VRAVHHAHVSYAVAAAFGFCSILVFWSYSKLDQDRISQSRPLGSLEQDFTVHDDLPVTVSTASKICPFVINYFCVVIFSACVLLLQVVVMSATMDVDHFSKYFNDAPVLYIEGRQHHVEVRCCHQCVEFFIILVYYTDIFL